MNTWMNALIKKFIRDGTIETKDKEIIGYYLSIKIEQVFILTTLLVLAAFMQRISQTVIFVISFMTIRRRTGGYHADSFEKCFFGTVTMYVAVMGGMYAFLMNNMHFTYVLLMIAVGILEFIGAVNHPNMHWDEGELRISKHLAREIVGVEIGVICILRLLGVDNSCIVSMALAICLSALLLLISKLLKQEVEEWEVQ